MRMDRHELLTWLQETDPDRLRTLRETADAVRAEHVGADVHFRGLIEFSNICRRSCWYCGIRAGNTEIQRYRLGREHIIESARLARKLGFGSIVMQSGEDPGLDVDDLCETIRLIRAETDLAITLSLGERSFDELARLKIAGADRYLLRFETSNTELYNRIHPAVPGQPNADRFEILQWLAELGYEVGTGIMVGIPGSTWEDLAGDIETFTRYDIDMIGIGPFIPHPRTPLGGSGPFPNRPFPNRPFPNRSFPNRPFPKSHTSCSSLQTPSRCEHQEGVDPFPQTQNPKPQPLNPSSPLIPERSSGRRAGEEGPPNTPEMVLKVLALTRIMCPDINIPSTTALETADPDKGYESGLCWGANVIMPNLTAMEYRRMYEIYPGKTGIARPAEQLMRRMTDSLEKMGRCPGKGPGRSLHYEKRFFER